MTKIHELNERTQHGYWQIRVYYDGKQTPASTLQIADKDQAREQYEAASEKAMRDPARPFWRVQLVWCVVTETVVEQDGTSY
jgi:hypothetical protein